MRYKALLFDLDGTVLDTLGDLTDAINYALAEQGYAKRTEEEVCSFVGNGIRMLAKRASGAELSDEALRKMLADFKEYYEVHCADKTRPYPGILGLLCRAKAEGCLLAMVSNKADYAVQALAETFFSGIFDYVTGERDGIPRKPDPTGVETALQALGVGKADAVYVGDSGVDLKTAENAGVECVSVTWGFRNRDVLSESGAKTLVDSAEELEAYLF